ncbi:PEP-CTERM sorting domain-containing protein [Haloferula sp. A504]|uniref:PEP-CTERM sorting domain-containing protein n=1 Tax=Haloferula sp. A504 TaxID=3373601 RepID=UPI0031C85922|nr:PEP-CTERM sorting domain-containing protein [Verrucomicrobiaceae bacterium E54]
MKTLIAVAAFGSITLAAPAALVVVDNFIGEPNGDTAGAVAAFAVQSFTPNVAGPGATDTVAANAPLPSTVYLQSATFLRAVTGVETAGQLYLNVYQGNDGDDGTFLGSSINSIDVNSATALSSLVWNFDNIALDSSLETALVWSTTNTAGTSVLARIQVARDSAGNFGDSYTAGTADNNADNSSPPSFDARFAVQFSTVPEPSSSVSLLASMALLVLIRRRRG